MRQIGVGRIFFWEGGSLWIGRAEGQTELHAHHAIQLGLALTGQLSFRTDSEDWRAFTAVLVPSHRPHALDAGGEQVAHLFVEPESVEGRALLARFGTAALAPLPAAEIAPLAERLLCAHTGGAAAEAHIAACRELIATLAATASPRVLDARVDRTLRALARQLDDPPSLSEAAAAAHLSPGRFRHLFVSQTGQSFRSYLLWRRLQRAIEVISAGDSATAAAHAAGFADAAHLARTFRRMMGISPSSVSVE